jgi:hypothetical protein
MSSAAVDKRSTMGRVANERDNVVMLAPFELSSLPGEIRYLVVFAFSMPDRTNRVSRHFPEKQREKALIFMVSRCSASSLRHFRFELTTVLNGPVNLRAAAGQNLCGVNRSVFELRHAEPTLRVPAATTRVLSAAGR